MTIVCEVAVLPENGDGDAAPHQFDADLARNWERLPGLVTLDFYRPTTGGARDPYVDDGPAPRHLMMFAFASLAALDQAARDPAFAAGLLALGTVDSCTAMQRSDHPVAGEMQAAALSAPFSYVVRYHRPAADEAAFVRHYVDTHPPLLARLPDICNVMCYVPVAWQDPGGLPSADYLIGNEVTFMHHAAFNAAMASPVRHELRAHFHTFPAYSGRNTHFAMQRTRLFG